MRRPARTLTTAAPVTAALGVAALAASAALLATGGAAASDAPAGAELRDVMYVGNNWDGTVNLVDVDSFEVLQGGVSLIPDREEELTRIASSPENLALYLAIQQGPGEGNDQYVDDMFATRDGRFLAVSRPSFGDVVWVDVAKALAGDPSMIVVEQSMDGFRTDHMGISPDGRRLVVSDSTARQVIEYSMVDEVLPDGTAVAMGDRTRTFESGETPHESNYSDDGERIYHASIGRVYLPGDTALTVFGPDATVPITGDLLGQEVPTLAPVRIGADPANDGVKGDRWLQVVDNGTFEVLQRWDAAKELAEAGYPSMQASVRPMAIGPGERFLYFQVSYFHGLVEFDTQAPDLDATRYQVGTETEPDVGAVTRVIPLEQRTTLPLELYVNDSAHHGMAISEDGDTLCVAGTMDDYAALVDVETMTPTYFDETTNGNAYGKPYWTVEGPDDTCWISLSETDAVAVLDMGTGEELAHFPVGNHPQRVRQAVVPAAFLQADEETAPGAPATGGATGGEAATGTTGATGAAGSAGATGSRLAATGPAAAVGVVGLALVGGAAALHRRRTA